MKRISVAGRYDCRVSSDPAEAVYYEHTGLAIDRRSSETAINR